VVVRSNSAGVSFVDAFNFNVGHLRNLTG